jgi:hypothetical protein
MPRYFVVLKREQRCGVTIDAPSDVAVRAYLDDPDNHIVLLGRIPDAGWGNDGAVDVDWTGATIEEVPSDDPNGLFRNVKVVIS